MDERDRAAQLTQLQSAAAQLADAVSGAMVAAAFVDDPDWADDDKATWWFCRKALWDYADARADGWEPDCSEDRAAPPATVAYALKEAATERGSGAIGWAVVDARADRPLVGAPAGASSPPGTAPESAGNSPGAPDGKD